MRQDVSLSILHSPSTLLPKRKTSTDGRLLVVKRGSKPLTQGASQRIEPGITLKHTSGVDSAVALLSCSGSEILRSARSRHVGAASRTTYGQKAHTHPRWHVARLRCSSPDEASSAVNNTNSKSARTTTAYSTSKLQTKSWVTIVLVTAAAALTGCWIYWKFGFDLASQFFSVYLVEQSLSADNVLVMYLIFEKFRVPEQHRPRVLFWGVLTAAVLRVAMISVGALGMLNFRWMNLLFAAVILHSGFSMLAPGDEEDDDDMESSSIITSVQRWLPVTAEYHGGRFVARESGRWKATPLLVVLLAIELTDVVFSWDNVAAVFGCSTNMTVIWTATMFAIITLRSWFSIISQVQPTLGLESAHFQWRFREQRPE
ncbi:hypothetical protein CYMTET_31140 [Cymbomonas tetramitiformis]|uniref:Uncharacterized protein n=1 Tax=Cymbomonas tetramitiformis TaxID=36881 RepID=A0AAE0KTH8_9CHLO|nr:hypothetical protein CYMTET_31140 [Cymbomonas tetramitiformis]